MLIHAYLRKEPITVELFDTVVQFEVNDAGHVVAPVKEERVSARLLEIAEAYRRYDGKAAAPAPAPKAAPVLARPASLADEVAIGEDSFVSGASILEAAFNAADVTLEAWNALPEERREEHVRNAINRMLSAVSTPSADEAEADPLVLVNDAGEKLDIGQMTAKQVRALAKDNTIELPAGNSTPVAELRALLAKGLKGE